MTPYGRDDAPRPFTPAELDGIADTAPDELLALGRVARELEAAAERGGVRPSPDFADRVMRSIAAEPSPAPVWAAGVAVRRHSPTAVLASLRDALRVGFGAGFPIAVRAQALALVLLVTAVFATGGGMATVGAVRLLSGNPLPGFPDATARPVATGPVETPAGSLDPSAVSGSPDPSDPSEPSASDHPDASGSDAPGESPEASDQNGNGGGTGHDNGRSPQPTETPHPTESDQHDNGGGLGGSGDPQPTEAPQPTESPWPTPVQVPVPSPAETSKP